MRPTTWRWILLLAAALAVPASAAEEAQAGAVTGDAPRVLVYTRNFTPDGKGYVHDNIAASVAALRAIGTERGVAVDVADEPTVFTDANLKRYRAVVFSNSNNEAFATEEQRQAFQRFIRAGRGFVGIHSASGSERAWPWFWALLGGTFAWHPPLQPFTIRIVDRQHPSTCVLKGDTWSWEDELYVHKERNAGVRTLLVGDTRTLKDPGQRPAEVPPLPDLIPLAWSHEFEGGRSFYTALGHKPEHYADPTLRAHLAGGLLWAMGLDGPACGR